jgi:DNA-binding MarR family transcriptional regulator
MEHANGTALSDMSGNNSESPYQLQSLARAVAVLEMLGESQIPLSLAEICHRMQIHKSTAHRSLMVLERITLIERTQDNRFRLELKLYELGNRAVGRLIYVHGFVRISGGSPLNSAKRYILAFYRRRRLFTSTKQSRIAASA